tara:strand:- start:3631 stop:4212 length:582 start_codon:yes stop_codon:yes gene_type:complete
MKLLNKSNLELALRQCVFLILNVYGLSKLLGGQFYMKGNLPAEIANTTLGEVNSFSIAWTFMGHSYAYVLFVALSQLLGAWFLLWNKTKLLGILILMPIMVNIMLFDVIFLDVYPALANAVIVTVMLFLILNYNRERVFSAFQLLTGINQATTPHMNRRLSALVIAILAIISIYFFDTLIEYWLGASQYKITG